MLTIGLVLLLAAGAVIADAVLENSQHLNLTLFGQNAHLPFWEVALGAFVVGAIVVLGLTLFLRGTRRMASLSAERRRLRREVARRPAVAESTAEVPVAQEESGAAPHRPAAPSPVSSAAREAYPDEPTPARARHRRRRGAATAGSSTASPG